MLNLKNKKVVLNEIEKLKKELQTAKGLFAKASIEDDLQYMNDKLKSL